jgi:hypothetical protein
MPFKWPIIWLFNIYYLTYRSFSMYATTWK